MPQRLNDVNRLSPIPLLGSALAHFRGTLLDRVFLGAELVHGTKVLIDPNCCQVSKLVGVSPSSLWWGVKRFDDRFAIEHGWLPLVPARSIPKPASREITNGTITDAELAEMIRCAGIMRVIDAAAAVEAAQ
jgi:hypothetical protein